MSTARFSDLAETPAIPRLAPPETNAGFKDWALVCEALGSGRQSVILRKGGIAEGRDGFRFKHEAFYLFPTQYHQQAERIRPDDAATLGPVVAPAEGSMEICYFFALEWAVWMDDWSVVERLEPFHIWREDVVRERFEYGEARVSSARSDGFTASTRHGLFPTGLPTADAGRGSRFRKFQARFRWPPCWMTHGTTRLRMNCAPRFS